MAKINIHIELDPKVDTLESLIAIAHAFGGKVTLEPKVVAPAEPKVSDPEPGTTEPGKVEDPKKVKKVKTAEIKAGKIVDLGQKVPGVTEEKLPESFEGQLEKGSKKVENKEPEATIDDVRKVMADAKRAGKTNEVLKGILAKFDAEGVSQLDPSNYNAVIKAVKEL